MAKRFIFWFITLMMPVMVAAVGAELYLRAMNPHEAFNAGWESPGQSPRGPTDVSTYVTLDPDFGWRPTLDTPIYDRYGALRNEYDPNDRKGRIRLLFLGDSVTRRGHTIAALKRLYGDGKFEFWNAGVEGYNPLQEITYYRRFAASLEPDHVILSLHNNDLETIPVAFINDEGRLVVFASNIMLGRVESWLVVHSLLYRGALGLFFDFAEERAKIIQEVRAEFLVFGDELAARGVRLTVILFPIVSPDGQWKIHEAENHQQLRTILADLDLRFFDLTPAYQAAIQCELPVQENTGDTWHPGPEVSELFAAYLHRRGMLTQGRGDNDRGPSGLADEAPPIGLPRMIGAVDRARSPTTLCRSRPSGP